MDERISTSSNEHEPQPDITRQQVIDVYRALSGDGDLDPADLDLDDPKVIAANELFFKWQEQQKDQLSSDDEAYFRFEVETDTLFVDAGFHDRNYLDEVANDWLLQTLERIEDAGLTSLSEEVESKRAQINTMVSQEGEIDSKETTPDTQEVLEKLAGTLSADNMEFLEEQITEGMDFDNVLGFVYGALLEEGHDPDETLRDLGIVE